MIQDHTEPRRAASCAKCGSAGAREYEQYFFSEVGVPAETGKIWLCVKCARAERRLIRAAQAEQLRAHQLTDDQQVTREELIAAMDRFWAESGAGEICGRCHAQGTGCCPPMCRHLGAHGCLEKNVFCTSFICSALLNAISECDPETGRLLKWMKWNPGSAEFRLYEMVTRVPPVDREQTRPLALPVLYPGPLRLSGAQIREKLLQLADEVLEIRRRWNQLERRPFEEAEDNSQ
ncbi:MAG TPA: hypothetical protein VNQ79_17745 [Blastocatellia bacterium]|nr:hypothetical protein [Blastocatellia bacterium]